MFPYGFTLTVHRSSGTDRYGHALPGVDHDIDGCAAAPAGSVEGVGSSSQFARSSGDSVVITQDTVYAPYGADVVAQDTVSVPTGQPIPAGRYLVDGQPASWRSPFTGDELGTAIRLTRVT